MPQYLGRDTCELTRDNPAQSAPSESPPTINCKTTRAQKLHPELGSGGRWEEKTLHLILSQRRWAENLPTLGAGNKNEEAPEMGHGDMLVSSSLYFNIAEV